MDYRAIHDREAILDWADIWITRSEKLEAIFMDARFAKSYRDKASFLCEILLERVAGLTDRCKELCEGFPKESHAEYVKRCQICN